MTKRTSEFNQPFSLEASYQRMQEERSPTSPRTEVEGVQPNINDESSMQTNPTLIQSLQQYLNSPSLLLELLMCIIFALLSIFTPTYVFGMKTYQRQIPYLMMDDGELILDQYIDRPLVDHETVSTNVLVLICDLLAPLLLVAMSFSSTLSVKDDLHSSICALILSIASTNAVTNCMKMYAGYFRPNFYNLCGFDEDSRECESNDDQALYNSRLSFPSGHASHSFSSMGILTLIFLGKVGLHRGLLWERNRTIDSDVLVAPSLKKKILSLLSLSPMALATFIATSRVHDDYHHPADVVAGAFIGLFCAHFAYNLWYPSVYSCFAGYPLTTAYEKMKKGININESNANGII